MLFEGQEIETFLNLLRKNQCSKTKSALSNDRIFPRLVKNYLHFSKLLLANQL